MDVLKTVSRLLRLPQWLKSSFVFIGVFYSKQWGLLDQAFEAALAFSLLASAIYIYNDIHDIEEDRRHPRKKYRVLAAGKISVRTACLFMLVSMLAAFSIGFFVSNDLALILLIYLLINLAYNWRLKYLPFIDVVCISSGFLLRVLAGTLGIGIEISCWLTITATLLSLYIALGKRCLARIDLSREQHRNMRKMIGRSWLSCLMLLSGLCCFISYSLYVEWGHDGGSYFRLSLLFAALGLLRFYQLCHSPKDGEDPVMVLFNDRISMVNLTGFILISFKAVSS